MRSARDGIVAWLADTSTIGLAGACGDGRFATVILHFCDSHKTAISRLDHSDSHSHLPSNPGSQQMRTFLALAALVSVSCLPAYGQFATAVQACTHDTQKYCTHDAAPKGADFAACINGHYEAFSAQCKTALAKVASATSACSDDIAKQCPGIRPGSGRILLCVKKHYPALSEACKAAISQAAASRVQARGQN